MKKFFRELISDDNSINEQAFVGVISFFAMVFVLLVDVVTGVFSKELLVKEFIFDGFMILTLGAFGITTAGRIMSLKKKAEEKKEETGKEIYSEFSKGMLSNVYNTESLKQSIGDAKESIVVLNNEIDDANQKISDVDSRLKKGQEYKDNLLNSKFSDIDQDLIRLNPITIQSEISNLENSKVNLVEQIKGVKIVEPKEFYHEDKHDEIKESMKNVNGDLVLAQNKVEEIEQLIKKFGDGIQCEHCGIKLMEAALTKKKIDELGDWEKKVETLSKKWKDLDRKEKSYTQLKKDFDEYERNKFNELKC